MATSELEEEVDAVEVEAQVGPVTVLLSIVTSAPIARARHGFHKNNLNKSYSVFKQS